MITLPGSLAKKLVAAAVSAALILVSPGLPAYQAWAGDVGSKGGPVSGALPQLPAPAIGTGGMSQGLPSVSLPQISIGGLAAPNIPGPEIAVSLPGLQPGGMSVPAPVASVPGAQKQAPVAGRLSASAPQQPQNGGGANANEPVKAEGSKKGVEPAAETPEQPGSREELAAALKDEKSDKAGVLSWVFDRFKRKAAPADAVVGSESSVKSALTKAAGAVVKTNAVVPAPAADLAAKPKSRLQRLKDTFDFSEFNKSEKAYLKAESVFYFAIAVYLASLPILVQGITGDAAATGIARGIHYWTMAAAALFAGEIVSRAGMKRVMKHSAMTRALIFGTIGVTAIAGVLGGSAGWPMFLGLVGLNALVISMHSLVNIKSGGGARVFESKAKLQKAVYLYSTIASAMMLIVPPLMGQVIDMLAKAYGPLVGSGAGYVAVGALLGAVGLLYRKVEPIKKSSDVAQDGTPAFQAFKKFFSELWATRHGKWGLSTLGAGALSFALVPLLGLGFWPMLAAIAAMAGGAMVAFNWDAIKAILGNKMILGRSGMATFEAFVDDALFAVVMPSFAVDILRAGAFGNGLLLSAITAGTLVASSFMLRNSQRLEKKLGGYRWLATLTVIAAFGFVPSILLWSGVPAFVAAPLGTVAAWLTSTIGGAFSVGLLVAIPAVMLMKVAVAPLQQRMGTLLQTTIDEDPVAQKQQDKIWSLMGFFEMLAAGAGGIAFSWLYKNSGTGSAVAEMIGANAPMKIVTAVLMVTGVVYFLGLRLMKGQLTKPTFKVHESGGKEPAAFAKLELNLKKMGLPPYETRVALDPVDARRPTVAILSPASVYKMSIALEGARQSPGDVHLALDPSWLIQENHPDGHSRLLLKKGLTFENGKAVVVEYKTPRPVRYFGNFYTLGANDRDDGVPLEKDHDAPQSSSVHLEKTTNDKLLTRLMLAAGGVAVPATAAFFMAAHPLRGTSSNATTMQVKPMTEDRAAIRASLEEFLKHYQGDQVVVKPSGPQFHSGRGVDYFSRSDVDGMVEHALSLRKHEMMTEDGVVLAEERIVPPALYVRAEDAAADRRAVLLGKMAPVRLLKKDEIAGAGPKEKKDWNVRVLAARAPWGKGATTAMFVRAGAWGVPTNAIPDTINAADAEPILAAHGLAADDALRALGKRPAIDDIVAWARERRASLSEAAASALKTDLQLPDAAAVLKMEDVIAALREQHGLLKTEAEADQFIADLKKMGADAIDAIAANEASRERKDGEPKQDQTDFIGLDVMVVVENGRLVPKIIEVNDHDAGGQFELDQFHPESKGAHSREWVATMLERARLDALKGKRIVIVGAGYQGKRFIYERAKELGVEIVLVDRGLPAWKRWLGKALRPFGVKFKDHWAVDLVSEFIAVDTTKHAEALGKARKKLQRSARKNGKIDGIATFWEDDVPLTAEIARALQLPYHTVDAADSVRSKLKTLEVLEKAGVPAARFQRVKSPDELGPAMRKVGFPAVLKPSFGAESMGVVRVNNEVELRAAYANISRQLNSELDDLFGAYGNEMVLMQYLEGREWDQDVVMQDGKAYVLPPTDNWPTKEPNFTATGSSLPSRTLSKAEQAEVGSLAAVAAQVLGLRDGVIHVEGKTTSEGPRIIEVNGRMGGVYVRDWHKAVSGVDLVDQQLLVAAGVPIGPFIAQTPITHLEGEFVIHDQSGTLARQDLSDDAKRHPGLHNFRVMKKPGDRVVVPFNARSAMIEAKGDTPEEAQRNLDTLRAQLILDVEKDR